MKTQLLVLLWSDALNAQIDGTLRSICLQTLADYQVIVLGDERVEKRFEKERDSLHLDDRFSFQLMERPSSETIRRIIEDVSPVTVHFSLAGPIYRFDAFEKLYGTYFNEHAQIAFGQYTEGAFNPTQWDASLHDFIPAYWLEWPSNVTRPGGEHRLEEVVDPRAADAARFVFPFSKLFDRELLLKALAEPFDYGFATFWVLGMRSQLLASTASIRYTASEICLCPDLGPIEDLAGARSCLDDLLDNYLPSFSDVASFASGEGPERTGRGGEFWATGENGTLDQATWLSKSLESGLADTFLSRYWLLSEQSRGRLDDLARTCAEICGAPAVDTVSNRYGYLRFMLEGREPFAKLHSDPDFSFVIKRDASSPEARTHVHALIAQRCASFEVLVPASLSQRDGSISEFSCVQLVQDAPDDASYRAAACAQARGRYVIFLDDDIFWRDDALSRVWDTLQYERVDMAIVLPLNGENNAGCKVLRMPFRTERCLLNAGSSVNGYDNSLNNKVIRLSALSKRHVAFSGDASTDCLMLLEKLDFRRYPFITLECCEPEAFFLNRAPSTLKATYRVRYLLDSLTHVPLADLLADVRKALANRKNARCKLKDQVLFLSNRGSAEELPANLKCIYDALPDKKKVVLAQSLPHSAEYIERLIKEISRSRVIVTDDYIHELELPEANIKQGQKVIQLWHAAGAFKKFGLDCFGQDIAKERAVHSCYTAAMVSSEGVRDIYAHAFGIPRERVLALGVPRTDALFDNALQGEKARRVLDAYPQLAKRRMLLYCPTFRQQMTRQVAWDARIDWTQLSEQLGKEWVLVVRKHPLELSSWPPHGYDNIIGVENLSSDDLMTVADVIMTDYSSIIFDASLLEKPMLFYCPDLDTYDRDFYLDFPDELPGEVITEDSEIVAAAMRALAAGGTAGAAERFRNKYLGACDGTSTARIADYIAQL